MTTSPRGRRRRRRGLGQALVEFAIVFPVFMFILAGMVQFGFILWGQNTLNQLARDVGRYAATLDCSTGAVALAQAKFVTLRGSAGGPWTPTAGTPAVVVSYRDASGAPTVVCPDTNADQVWVRVTAALDAPIFFPWVPGGGHLASTTDFRVEPKP